MKKKDKRGLFALVDESTHAAAKAAAGIAGQTLSEWVDGTLADAAGRALLKCGEAGKPFLKILRKTPA